MAIRLYKAVVQLAADSDLPSDTVNNDFYFVGSSAGSTEAADAAQLQSFLLDFYNTVPGVATKSISDFLGPQISSTSAAQKTLVYSQELPNLGDPWGSPIATLSWTLGPPDSSSPLPSEVAVVLSFHGDLTDVPETQANPTPPPAIIRPAARKRGRVYIGPLNTTAGATQSGTNDLGVAGGFRTTLREAALALRDASLATQVEWCVYSPTGLETSLVTGGAVDSAFDIQRRRGTDALTRETWGD